MSHHWGRRFRHALHRIAHYANPVTHVKAAVHLTKRAAYYANPKTHVKALERAGHFTARQAKKDYIKFNRVTAFIAPVVTPVLAFVGSLVPVFGLIIGPALSFAGAAIARVSDSVALRSHGITGHHNSQMARGKEQRTLKYGLFGSALGAVASLFGLSLAAAPAASASVGAGASGGAAADFGSTSGAIVGQQASTVGALGGAQVGAEVGSVAVGAFAVPTVPLSSSSQSAAPAKAAASGAAPSSGSGILGTGITWGQVGGVLTPLISVTQQVLKSLGIGQPKPADQASPAQQLAGSGGGGGGDAPPDLGAGGPLGELANDLAGLPLPVKLAAAAVGVGVVVLAFTEGRKAAA